MNKTVVATIVAMLHLGGTCSWATPWAFTSAWDKIGFDDDGMNVELLLDNPKIIRTAAIEPATPVRSIPRVFPNEAKLDPGTKAYLAAENTFLKSQVSGPRMSPETYSEVSLRCGAPTAGPEGRAFAGMYPNDLARGPNRTQSKARKRPFTQTTGTIDMNNELIAERGANLEKGKTFT